MTTLHTLSVPSSQGENELKYWIHVVLNGEVDVGVSASMWTNLSSVSKSIWQITSNYLNENFWFTFQKERALNKFNYYQPKRITVEFTSLTTNSSLKGQLANLLFKFSYKSLPNHITHIKFSDYFNEPLTRDSLPQSLVCVIFGDSFNQKVDNLLPNNIQNLVFGFNYNNNVDHLPLKLQYLKLGSCFVKNVDHLPLNLTHLFFSFDFNNSVDHLPPHLKILEFGWLFNKIVDHLPQMLLQLTFGYCFDRRLSNLAKSLTHLTLWNPYYDIQTIDLPPNLTHLTIVDQNHQPINLPKKIKITRKWR